MGVLLYWDTGRPLCLYVNAAFPLQFSRYLCSLPPFNDYSSSSYCWSTSEGGERWKNNEISKSVSSYGGYFRLKLSPTSGHCPRRLIFFKNLFYQNNCKEAMNIGGGHIRGVLFNFFVVKKCLFCIFWTLPSVSKTTPVLFLPTAKYSWNLHAHKIKSIITLKSAMTRDNVLPCTKPKNRYIQQHKKDRGL